MGILKVDFDEEEYDISSFLVFCCCCVNKAVPSAVSWSRGTIDIVGGGTVRLRGGAAIGSTVLVGIVEKLKETDLELSVAAGAVCVCVCVCEGGEWVISHFSYLPSSSSEPAEAAVVRDALFLQSPLKINNRKKIIQKSFTRLPLSLVAVFLVVAVD